MTGKLLAHFGIENRLERCDENVIAAKSPALVSRMLDGEEVAFCSRMRACRASAIRAACLSTPRA